MGLQLHIRVKLGSHRGALGSRKYKGRSREVRWSYTTRLLVRSRVQVTHHALDLLQRPLAPCLQQLVLLTHPLPLAVEQLQKPAMESHSQLREG